MSHSETEERPVLGGVEPPPPAPTYDRAVGNQFRWAKQVVRYSLAQLKAKSQSEDKDTSSKSGSPT